MAMKIYEKETHEAKYLTVAYEDSVSQLDDKLIASLDSRCLLKPHSTDPDGLMTRYDISQYETLEQYLINRKLSRTEMVGMLAQLNSVIGVLEDHMLTDGNILLEPAYVFIDSLNRKVRFIPVHTQEGEFTERLRPLVEAIFLHADISHVEALYLASGLMKVLLKGNVHMHDMMQLIDHQHCERSYIEGWEQQGSCETGQASGKQQDTENDQVTVLLATQETEGGTTTVEVSSNPAEEEPGQLQEKSGIRGLFSGFGAKVKELVDGDE